MQHQIPDHQEIEWQLQASDLGSVEDWLEEHRSASGLAVVPGATKQLTDTYYDTEDWRLYRAGYSLRVRRDGDGAEATMKALAPTENGLRRRREISEPLEDDVQIRNQILKGAPGPVGERVRRLAGTMGLRPLFEVRTRRRIFALCPGRPSGSSVGVVEDASGEIRPRERDAAVGEIALDDSEISGRGGEPIHLSRVEVEVASEAVIKDGVGDFVESLRDALDLRPTEASKFRTGLASADLSPAAAPDLGPMEIEASMSAGGVAFAILRSYFAKMLAHEPGARLGEDPEALHDMRVATSRLRATLKLYAHVLPRRVERYEGELRHFSRVLGDVRDLDVYLERLSGEASRNGEVLEEVLALLEERKTETRRRMLEALDSNRYERFVATFSGTLRRGRSPAPTGPILEVAPDLLRRCYKQVRKTAGALTEESLPEDFHDLRKKGKRLRYALEPLQEIYGRPAEKMVGLLKTAQDALGDHQDRIVAAELMEELGTAGDLPPRTAFSMGSMAGHHVRDVAEVRAGFLRSKQLRALKGGRPWRKLRKTVKKKRAGG